MLEVLAYGIGAIFLLLAVFFVLTDSAAFVGTILAPIGRWVQKVFFGIDKPRAGPEALLGRTATVSKDFAVLDSSKGLEGSVVLDGETWKALCSATEPRLRTGEVVRVAERRGLTLVVEPCNGAT
jgi:membrane protein implicated in regulation of membrane protease activity